MATIRTDERTGNLFKRLSVKLPSGKKVRTQASPAAYGLPQTESGMREAEQRKVAEVYAQHATPTFNPSPNPVAASIVDAPPTITVTAKEVPTFGAYFPIWYANGETNGNKVQTLYKKRTFRNAVLPRFANARLDAIDAAAIRAWRNELHRAGLHPSTINGRLTELASVLRLAVIDGFLPAVPPFERMKLDRAEVAYFTPAQVDALIDGAHAIGKPLIATLIDLASRTGLRIGELRALRWEDVNLAAGEVTIRHSLARGRVDSPKNRKPRVLPLSPEAVRLLRAHQATVTGAYVFPGRVAPRIADNTLRRAFNAACAAAKVERPTSIKSCNAWHMLRHSFATEMGKRVEPQVLSRLMSHGGGNGDLRVTQRYIHASGEDMRRAMREADVGRRTVTPTAAPTQPPTAAPSATVADLAA